jgi:hypothetical protein
MASQEKYHPFYLDESDKVSPMVLSFKLLLILNKIIFSKLDKKKYFGLISDLKSYMLNKEIIKDIKKSKLLMLKLFLAYIFIL